MSKVLIDRELLEGLIEQYIAEMGYTNSTAHHAQKVLAAPSGTPTMPVKAYYHESTRETGAIHRSVGLEVRKAFIDAPLVLESDALTQIACLEGEIAKRDARIVELSDHITFVVEESNRFRKERDRLRAELSAAKETISRYETTAENCDLLRGELAAIKVQGVVMPERKQYPSQSTYPDGKEFSAACGEVQGFNRCLDEVARLNAAPVQRVSVPDGLELIKRMQVCLSLDDTEWGLSAPEKYKLLGDIKSYVLAAPAAPAADAGIVDMYRHLQKVTPYRFKKIQDASITDGGDVMYFHADRFDSAVIADMAAHRAAQEVE